MEVVIFMGEFCCPILLKINYHALEITTVNTFTPETKTMEILNLALLSNS